MVRSPRSGKPARSASRTRVNSTLPAPMSVILVMSVIVLLLARSAQERASLGRRSCGSRRVSCAGDRGRPAREQLDRRMPVRGGALSRARRAARRRQLPLRAVPAHPRPCRRLHAARLGRPGAARGSRPALVCGRRTRARVLRGVRREPVLAREPAARPYPSPPAPSIDPPACARSPTSTSPARATTTRSPTRSSSMRAAATADLSGADLGADRRGRRDRLKPARRAGRAGARAAAGGLVDVVEVEPGSAREVALIADVRDGPAIRAACEGADGIVHLAGIPDEADFHDLADVNITGTYHVLEAARLSGARRVDHRQQQPRHRASTRRRPPSIPRWWCDPTACTASARSPTRRSGGCTRRSSACRSRACGSEASSRRRRTSAQLSTWLSPRDCLAAVVAAMTAPELTFAAFYGVSRNTRRWWDLTAGEALGFFAAGRRRGFRRRSRLSCRRPVRRAASPREACLPRPRTRQTASACSPAIVTSAARVSRGSRSSSAWPRSGSVR